MKWNWIYNHNLSICKNSHAWFSLWFDGNVIAGQCPTWANHIVWWIEIFMFHPRTMSVQSHNRYCNIDASENQHSGFEDSFSGQSNAQHCFTQRWWDERQRTMANGELSGFFSPMWLMTELSRGRHTSQSTESAELLQKSFLHLCPSTVFSHFIFHCAIQTTNYSLSQRHSQRRNLPQWLTLPTQTAVF